MKQSEIAVGGLYHDDKLGIRELVSIKDGEVTYRTLSAKAEQYWDHAEKTMKSDIGSVSTMTLAAFSSWAKSRFEATDLPKLMAMVGAKRVKLTAIEMEHLGLVKSSTDYLLPMRVQSGLVKKGVIVRAPESTGYDFTLMGSHIVETLSA